MNHMTAVTVAKLVRKHVKTIRGLADAMNVPQARARQVRASGRRG
jgi:hypothetical protein